MSPGKGKRVALTIVGLAAITVGIAGIASWRSICERWQLHAIEAGDAAGKRRAVERLGKLKSTRAVPALVEALDHADDDLMKGIVQASVSIGSEAAPVVFQVMIRAEGRGKHEVLLLAMEALTEMGPAALVGWRTQDPLVRREYARALWRKGRRAESLEEYLWCYDHRGEHSILSDLLPEIIRLGATHRPAIDALKERSRRLEELILAGTLEESRDSRSDPTDLVHEFVRLNTELNDRSRILSLFNRSRDMKEGHRLRKRLVDEVIDRLLAERRYAEVVEAAADIERRLFQNAVIVKYYEALLGAGHLDRAAGLARQLIALSPTRETYSALIRHAFRAGRSAQAEEFLAEAKRTQGLRFVPEPVEAAPLQGEPLEAVAETVSFEEGR